MCAGQVLWLQACSCLSLAALTSVQVGPKASPGTPLDKPTEVPKPGAPG